MPPAYRLAWYVWVLFGAVYIAAYPLIVHSPTGASPSLLLVPLLLQPILVPAYIWTEHFTSRLQAVIRSTAAAVGFFGASVPLVLLRLKFSHDPNEAGSFDGLQLRYVAAILVVAGLCGGVQLGLLRWRFLQQGAAPPAPARLASRWRRLAHSAAIWTAIVSFICWIAAPRYASNFAYLGFLIGIAGLLLIVPIPVVFPAPPSGTPQVWRYFWRAAVVLVGTWGILVLLAIGAQSLYSLYLIVSLPYWLLLLVPMFLWALAYGMAEEPGSERASVPPTRPPGTGRVVLGSVIPLSAALVAGLLMTAPASLGAHGIGCRSTYAGIAADYWFWKAYRGIGSEHQTQDTMVFRPAGLPDACVVLDRMRLIYLQDPVAHTLGYAEAARTLYWLVDSADWTGRHTAQVRLELAELLGRDFRSYHALEDWWTTNADWLVWNGSNPRLEVHEPSTEELAHLYSYRQTHPVTTPSAVERIRSSPYLVNSVNNPSGVPDEGGAFDAALLDPEVRFRGLMLAAGDQIAILTGERSRLAREYVERVTGQHFATATEWDHFFAQGYPPAPWRMTRASALEWIAMIQVYGKAEPYRTRYSTKLAEETGVSFATADAFVPWLQDSTHTRGEEWQRAGELWRQIVDETNQAPIEGLAVRYLENITGLTFATKQEWVRWWDSSHARLILSPDGRKLVTGSRTS